MTADVPFAAADHAPPLGGIVDWHAYVPAWRLRLSDISRALGATDSSSGARTVAGADEDTTSMAVEAARGVVQAGGMAPELVLHSTTSLPYVEKNNASVVHAALSLDESIPAFDVCGATRSSTAALLLAAAWSQQRPVLVTMSDTRDGLSGSVDERDGGDAAAAFLVGGEGAVADVIGRGHATVEVLGRWRAPGATTADRSEDRFIDNVHLRAASNAAARALAAAGVSGDDVDHAVVTSWSERLSRAVLQRIGCPKHAAVSGVASDIGYAGGAQAGLALCEALDRATPGETLLLVAVADGADAVVLRTTGALSEAQNRHRSSASQEGAGGVRPGAIDINYLTYLQWKGRLAREPQRRPPQPRPAAPASLRDASWKFALEGSMCGSCHTRHFPPTRICQECHGLDDFTTVQLQGERGTVVTFTVDRLAATDGPSVIVAVIDLDGGGRWLCELTDVSENDVAVGIRVEPTFRRLHSSGGVHNYGWKARPVEKAASDERTV